MAFFGRLLIKSLVFGLILAVVGFGLDVPYGTTSLVGHTADIAAGIGIGIVLVDLFLLFWVVLIWATVGFAKNVRHAQQPIPSLGEIELQLRREGFDPSIQDVLAVEQHLKSERNESIAAAALYVGAVHVIGRTAAGKPIL